MVGTVYPTHLPTGHETYRIKGLVPMPFLADQALWIPAYAGMTEGVSAILL